MKRLARAHILFWKEIHLCRKVTEKALGGIYTTHRSVLLPRLKSKEYDSLSRKTSEGPVQLERYRSEWPQVAQVQLCLMELTVWWHVNINPAGGGVQLLRSVFVNPWTVAHQAFLSFTISRVCSNLCPLSQWCYPAISSSVTPFLSCPQSFPESGSFPMSRLLETGLPKYWSFSFSISPSNEYSGLISFRIGWYQTLLLAVQELKTIREASLT